MRCAVQVSSQQFGSVHIKVTTERSWMPLGEIYFPFFRSVPSCNRGWMCKQTMKALSVSVLELEVGAKNRTPSCWSESEL
jgi:hypothetical protein